MNTWKVTKNSGFTVIELMIVVLIVAILAALAYPSYTQYVRKSKRGEAQQLLMNWSINQEIWRSNNTLYASETDLAVPLNDNYDFDLLVDPPTAIAYTLRAIAHDDQANDESRAGTNCATLTLDQSGLKDPPACWD